MSTLKCRITYLWGLIVEEKAGLILIFFQQSDYYPLEYKALKGEPIKGEIILGSPQRY